MPKVSVLMPVFNAEEYIQEAISSVLDQTFKDFELIIVDDFSTDGSKNIINAIKDDRIKLITNKKEKGVVGALNTGIEIAKGEYIIRMDADDISLPNRFKIQVEFMDKNPDIGLSGSWYKTFGSSNQVKEFPTESDLIKCSLLLHAALSHPTIIFRRQLFKDNNIFYNKKFVYAEDLDFYTQASYVTKLSNIPQVLLHYRDHKNSVSNKYSTIQNLSARFIRQNQLMKVGFYPTFADMEIHQSVSVWHNQNQNNFIDKVLNVFEKLIAHNQKSNVYNNLVLSKYLINQWLEFYQGTTNKTEELTKHAKNFEDLLKDESLINNWNKEIANKYTTNEVAYDPNNLKVSIVMAAYNSQRFLGEAIESMLNQSYKNFELIIINDGSQDATESIIKSYEEKDRRVKLMHNKYDKGISGAANTGIDAAKGEYIARMDSDDISFPNRLEEQINLMDSNPEIGVVGAWVKLIGVDEDIVWENPQDPDYIKSIMLFYGAVSNPVSMLRKKVLDDNNFRYVKTAAEDYEMFVRLSRVTKITNIPKVLLHYRMHENNFGKVNRQIQNESANYIRFNQLTELGIEATEEEKFIHSEVGFWNIQHEKEFLVDADKWFRKLIKANNIKKIFPEPTFSSLMVEKWFDIYKSGQYIGTVPVLNFLLRGMYFKASKRYRVKVAKQLIRRYLGRFKNKFLKRRNG